MKLMAPKTNAPDAVEAPISSLVIARLVMSKIVDAMPINADTP